MIPKGNQRGGGQQLATHLMNSHDNERVEVADVRGAVAQDLHGAFAEWGAEAKATQCRKYLYSLSINPDHRQGPFRREQYLDFIARAETKLGLSEQPRAVVFHVKHGREHCHVVWSRIDVEKLKAVQMSHDRQKLRSVAQGFARDHGITLPAGMRNDRGTKRFNDRAKVENLAEKQQEERSGVSKEERRKAITEAWRESGTGATFLRALEDRGYFLARGDRRAYVVIDLYGEVHSLARQIAGATTKDVKARLADYPLASLPDTPKAQEFARQKREAMKAPAPSREQEAATRRAALAQKHQQRRAALDVRREALEAQQRVEQGALQQKHRTVNATIADRRRETRPRGLAAWLGRITGIQALIDRRHQKQDRARLKEQAQEVQFLQRRQARELREFQRHDRALSRLEKRESKSLETALRREENRALKMAAKDRQAAQRARLEAFQKTGQEITSPPLEITKTFNERAQKPRERSVNSLKGLRENAAEITAPREPPAPAIPDSLAEAFKARARHKQRERERDQRDPGKKPPRDPGRDRER